MVKPIMTLAVVIPKELWAGNAALQPPFFGMTLGEYESADVSYNKSVWRDGL